MSQKQCSHGYFNHNNCNDRISEGILRKAMQKKVKRPMQETGVYDPMEQAGHRNMILIEDALEVFKQWLRLNRAKLSERILSDWDKSLIDHEYEKLLSDLEAKEK